MTAAADGDDAFPSSDDDRHSRCERPHVLGWNFMDVTRILLSCCDLSSHTIAAASPATGRRPAPLSSKEPNHRRYDGRVSWDCGFSMGQ